MKHFSHISPSTSASSFVNSIISGAVYFNASKYEPVYPSTRRISNLLVTLCGLEYEALISPSKRRALRNPDAGDRSGLFNVRRSDSNSRSPRLCHGRDTLNRDRFNLLRDALLSGSLLTVFQWEKLSTSFVFPTNTSDTCFDLTQYCTCGNSSSIAIRGTLLCVRQSDVLSRYTGLILASNPDS